MIKHIGKYIAIKVPEGSSNFKKIDHNILWDYDSKINAGGLALNSFKEVNFKIIGTLSHIMYSSAYHPGKELSDLIKDESINHNEWLVIEKIKL